MRAPLVEHASGDQNRKSALGIRRYRGDRLHSVPHQPFGLPPCVSKRRLAALSRCPDADRNCTCGSDRLEWHESSVSKRLSRDLHAGTPCTELADMNRKVFCTSAQHPVYFYVSSSSGQLYSLICDIHDNGRYRPNAARSTFTQGRKIAWATPGIPPE